MPGTELSLVYHNDDGQPISTQSMLKTFKRCPKQTDYKYVQRLKPRVQSKPLTQGTWMHSLFETDMKGGDWHEPHKILTAQFANLFDEERDHLGDLPRECARIMRSYKWHYANDVWTIHDVEFVLEAELPNGHIFRVKIDALVENEWGLWLVDHKFNKVLPSLSQRLIDLQSVLYVWAALKNRIPVNGFIWNYVRRKAPSIPQMTQAGRLSRRACDTDYPTAYKALKEYGLLAEHKPWLRQLQSLRYEHGALQKSTFFKRSVIERDPEQLRTIVRQALHTSKRMHEYPFDRTDIVERVPDRSCEFSCSYLDICTLEATGGDTRTLRRQRYEEVDPMYYYNDDPRGTGKDND